MSKLTIKYPTIKAKSIPEGTFFIATIGDYKGLFLRAYDVIVQVDDAHNTWSSYGWNDLPIYDYNPVNVEIKVTAWKDN